MVTLAKDARPEEIRQVIDAEGRLSRGASIPELPAGELLRVYRTMLLVRTLDERMLRLQRQGRLGFYMTATGEEATHMAVQPLRPSDWVFPCYREVGAAFLRGYSLREFLAQLYGNAADPGKGRQMPIHHTARALNFVSVSSPVGTQIPQATGAAMAARISKRDDVALVYFGDGATSTGEFHVGLNFAGVFRAPAIFLCRNNGWAISTSLAGQTAAASIAVKAAGYGMPGVRVDGNDVLALIQVTAEAAARARAGEGPTLIEALTYRRGAHSSSDDPSVYRDPAGPKEWEARDPIERFRRWLTREGLLDERRDAELRAAIDAEIGAAHEEIAALPPPPVASIVEDVFAEVPRHLAEQRDALLAGPRPKNPHVH